mmetsp:Transcript_8588/g.21161  ORF Transcript_8588/g.21161 Transcript_8588/m.21161 type:complete len:230 (+) Transcript_8588:584-1273(+)
MTLTAKCFRVSLLMLPRSSLSSQAGTLLGVIPLLRSKLIGILSSSMRRSRETSHTGFPGGPRGKRRATQCVAVCLSSSIILLLSLPLPSLSLAMAPTLTSLRTLTPSVISPSDMPSSTCSPAILLSCRPTSHALRMSMRRIVSLSFAGPRSPRACLLRCWRLTFVSTATQQLPSTLGLQVLSTSRVLLHQASTLLCFGMALCLQTALQRQRAALRSLASSRRFLLVSSS